MHRIYNSAVLSVAIGVVWSAPLFGQCPIGGAVQVDPLDAAMLGSTPAFRVYSLSQSCPGGTLLGCMNGNTAASIPDPACLNARCQAEFYYLGSEYLQATEDVWAYAGGAHNQVLYALYDAEANAGTGNHIAYYAVGGVVADNCTTPPGPVGNPLAPDCPAGGFNCMDYLDSRFSSPGTLGILGGVPIQSIGGFSPVPQVKITTGPTCPPGSSYTFGTVCLTWDEPATYSDAMRGNATNPAPSSPVIGVRLWKIQVPLTSCAVGPSGSDPGWASMGTFPLGSGAYGTTDTPTPGVCTYYALTVRVNGPGGGANEIETGARAGLFGTTAGFVGVNSVSVVGL